MNNLNKIRMYFAVILLTNILQLIEINGVTNGNNFKFSINQDVNSNIVATLIFNGKKSSSVMCANSCGMVSNCLTAVFRKSGLSNNCFLYDRYFISDELISSSNSTLYEKKISGKYQLNSVFSKSFHKNKFKFYFRNTFV